MRRAFILAVAVGAMPGVAAAQAIEFGIASAASDHKLLGERLVGATARVRLPWTAEHKAVSLGFQHLTGSARRVGTTCVGLVMPGDPCTQPEPLRDDARLWTASAALAFRPLAWSRVVLDVAPGLQLGYVRANTRGESSGERISATQALIGVDLGIDATWAPIPRIPVAVSAGFGVGGLMRVVPVATNDGYEPFGGFSLTRFRVAASWWPRR